MYSCIKMIWYLITHKGWYVINHKNQPTNQLTTKRGTETKESIVGGQELIIFTNPSARAGYDTRSIFKRGSQELMQALPTE